MIKTHKSTPLTTEVMYLLRSEVGEVERIKHKASVQSIVSALRSDQEGGKIAKSNQDISHAPQSFTSAI